MLALRGSLILILILKLLVRPRFAPAVPRMWRDAKSQFISMNSAKITTITLKYLGKLYYERDLKSLPS